MAMRFIADPEHESRNARMLRGAYPWADVGKETARVAISKLRTIDPRERAKVMNNIWESKDKFYQFLSTGKI